jgi:hypothetical protein
MQETKKAGKKLKADFINTGKNRMLYATFKFANFKEVQINKSGTKILENDLSLIQEFPSYIHLILQ